MTASIREAAQALLKLIGHAPPHIRPNVDGTYNERVEALYAVLAAPPEPGWAEGVEAAAKWLDDEGWEVAAEQVREGLRALPVPSAPAPEAKPAESVIGYFIAHRWEGQPFTLASQIPEGIELADGPENGVTATCRRWNAAGNHNPKHEYVPMRVRITVEPEPSPVEPEETQR